ncbi:MAG: transporter substrate-binding domain-containing protein [Pseudomonas sp.]|uniref:substrate-binding periplasmic protein n=1 Tax=Pseudomonas sp. TaxID=306 RepID=UPI0027340B10|nr:transporter substrate-binding domain-containing protein [Pseudomonas sp.]MDP3848372.1 transporter substrate-binding domain-containing protein [Pseudomonas sp.]
MLKRCCWLLLFCLGTAQAQTLRVCIGDASNPPLTFVDHDGQAQYLIRHAASQQGWTVEFEPVPWRRCRAGVESGRYHAAGTVTAAPSNREFMAFPLRAGQLDESLALGEFKVLVYRARGTDADWDGQRFTGLRAPVLYNAGFVAVADRLQQLNVTHNDSAQTIHQMMQMLLRDRAQLGVGQAASVERELQNPEFADIEVLPAPLMRAGLFLGVNKQFYAQHPQVFEAIWRGIGELRNSPEWSQLAPQLAH